MSESSDPSSLVLQFHPLMESVFLRNIDGQATEAQVLDSYATAVEEHYGCPAGTIRSACTRLIPFVPKYPTSQKGTTVGMPNLPTDTSFTEMFSGETGFCLVEVTPAHPFLRLAALSAQNSTRNKELETIITNLQASLASLGATVELLQSEAAKPATRKGGRKKQGAKAPAAVVTSNTTLAVKDHTSGLTEPSELNSPVLLAKIQQLELIMSQRDKALEVEHAEREMALEAERAERVMALEAERAERKKLEETTMALQALWATEKEERIEQYGEVVERAEDLEWCLSNQDPLLLDRIRLRTLLDAGQAKLAHFTGLVSPNDILTPSAVWRTRLDVRDGRKNSDEQRLKAAHGLLASRGLLPSPIDKLVKNPQAMRLLTQRRSSIRKRGNIVAHQLVDGSVLKEIVGRSVSGEVERTGVLGILEFIESS